MAEKLPMLALSPTMEQGVISKWLKQVGDPVENGDAVCEVETDKAVMEYQAMAEGVLLKIVVDEGEKASVGDTIALVGEEGEDISGMDTAAAAPAPKAVEPESTPAEEPTSTPPSAPAASTPAPGNKVRATPAARGLAAEKGVDLKSLSGSGPNGRVVLQDVEQAVADGKGGAVTPTTRPSVTAPAGSAIIQENDEVIALSETRKVIARRLSESKFSAPHFYLKLKVEMDEMLDLRKQLNGMRDEKISLNAFIIKMAAQALRHNPVINSSWNEDSIVQHPEIDIALAVAVNGGLLTPVVRDCGAKSIAEIDRDLKELIEKAKTGKLTPDEYTNATFTISNLGSFGIEDFTAIINPPGSAILAVGKTIRTPVVGENDEVVIKSLMQLSLSCDHRVIDGADGAKYMQDLQHMIHQPSLALA